MKKRMFLPLLLSLLLLLLAAGCGASSAMDNTAVTGRPAVAAPAAGEEAAVEAPAAEAQTAPADPEGKADENVPAEAEAKAEESAPAGPRLIYTANIELQTSAFDETAAGLEELVASKDGYFENNEQHGYNRDYRTASYTIRVPVKNFDALCTEIGSLCTQTYLNRTMEDVSEQYIDTDSRLSVAKTKHTRLLELLSKSEKMEDIISLEKALSETEYEIENLTGTLRKYDSLISYSTINIGLQEVSHVNANGNAPLSFGERLSEAFQLGLRHAQDYTEGFLFFVAENFFVLLILIIVIILVVCIVRSRRRKRADALKASQQHRLAPADTDPKPVSGGLPPEGAAKKPTPPENAGRKPTPNREPERKPAAPENAGRKPMPLREPERKPAAPENGNKAPVPPREPEKKLPFPKEGKRTAPRETEKKLPKEAEKPAPAKEAEKKAVPPKEPEKKPTSPEKP